MKKIRNTWKISAFAQYLKSLKGQEPIVYQEVYSQEVQFKIPFEKKEVVIVATSVLEDKLIVSLSNGKDLHMDWNKSVLLQNATHFQRQQVKITGGGHGLYWESVDEDLSLAGLLRDLVQIEKLSGALSTKELSRRQNRNLRKDQGAFRAKHPFSVPSRSERREALKLRAKSERGQLSPVEKNRFEQLKQAQEVYSQVLANRLQEAMFPNSDQPQQLNRKQRRIQMALERNID